MIGESIPNSTGYIGALSLDGLILPFEGKLDAALAAKKIGFTRMNPCPWDLLPITLLALRGKFNPIKTKIEFQVQFVIDLIFTYIAKSKPSE